MPSFGNFLSAFLVCALLALPSLAEAQTKKLSPSSPTRPPVGGPAVLKSVPKGAQEFKACCSSCPAGGCTGCNAYPNTPNINCGSGLIKADCQVVNDEATCVKDDG